GIGHANVGRHRPALLAFRRALQLDPDNRLARESMWRVHSEMDLSELQKDGETLSLVDVELCLDRAGYLLLNPGPAPEMLKEAHHLLDLVLGQRPALKAAVQYWRAVAFTHAKRFDEAAAALTSVLDGSVSSPDDPQRRAVLLRAWQLALTLHPEMNRRVGSP